MTARILGLTVGRNEAHRYLDSFLAWTTTVVDELFFFDDDSDDTTREMVMGYDVTLAARGFDTPSLLQHEGTFRQASWEAFVEAMHPEVGDWVLSIDCDEFFTTAAASERHVLGELADTGNAAGVLAYELPILEVFGFEPDGWPALRIDGYWAQIRDRRFFAWQPEGLFRDMTLGCGSAPTYTSRQWAHAPGGDGMARILHFGYADATDRADKHARYQDRAGHNPSHIASILQRPKLSRYPASTVPEVRRG